MSCAPWGLRCYPGRANEHWGDAELSLISVSGREQEIRVRIADSGYSDVIHPSDMLVMVVLNRTRRPAASRLADFRSAGVFTTATAATTSGGLLGLYLLHAGLGRRFELLHLHLFGGCVLDAKVRDLFCRERAQPACGTPCRFNDFVSGEASALGARVASHIVDATKGAGRPKRAEHIAHVVHFHELWLFEFENCQRDPVERFEPLVKEAIPYSKSHIKG
mmetsp:Transcript_107711/g.313502  ORF Transcript_107711/g.313502 Transcript_107711/m.313502 type:complete len:220 (-) Transcript_107711:550-1209(-)